MWSVQFLVHSRFSACVGYYCRVPSLLDFSLCFPHLAKRCLPGSTSSILWLFSVPFLGNSGFYIWVSVVICSSHEKTRALGRCNSFSNGNDWECCVYSGENTDLDTFAGRVTHGHSFYLLGTESSIARVVCARRGYLDRMWWLSWRLPAKKHQDRAAGEGRKVGKEPMNSSDIWSSQSLRTGEYQAW